MRKAGFVDLVFKFVGHFSICLNVSLYSEKKYSGSDVLGGFSLHVGAIVRLPYPVLSLCMAVQDQEN